MKYFARHSNILELEKYYNKYQEKHFYRDILVY